MIDVKKWESVRRGYYNEGKSVRTLMRETGHSFRTIRRIIEGNEPGHYVQKKGRAAPVLGAYKAQIDTMLEANASLPRKQQYTASRIYQRVREAGFAGAESTVRHYVSGVRKQVRRPAVFLPLSFEPGRGARDRRVVCDAPVLLAAHLRDGVSEPKAGSIFSRARGGVPPLWGCAVAVDL